MVAHLYPRLFALHVHPMHKKLVAKLCQMNHIFLAEHCGGQRETKRRGKIADQRPYVNETGRWWGEQELFPHTVNETPVNRVNLCVLRQRLFRY